MRALALQAAHHHRLAEIPHLRADAHHPPGRGEPAVGRHHQPRRQAATIGQGHSVVRAAGFDGGDRGAVQHFQISLALHRLPRSTTNQMVGHQPAKLVHVLAFGGKAQRKRRGTVHDTGAAQSRNLRRINALPQPHGLHELMRGMGECDLTAIKGRIGQRGGSLRLDHGHRQATARQTADQAQSGRAGSHHHYIHLAHFRLRHGTGSKPKQAAVRKH
ncbi:hypothetical protein D3C71_1391180 [compost metagenome]